MTEADKSDPTNVIGKQITRLIGDRCHRFISWYLLKIYDNDLSVKYAITFETSSVSHLKRTCISCFLHSIQIKNDTMCAYDATRLWNTCGIHREQRHKFFLEDNRKGYRHFVRKEGESIIHSLINLW